MDRISSLPSEIICHIVSFLSAKEAALASVLSKRWLHLYTIIPNLEFDDTVENQGSLKDFLDKVLALALSTRVRDFSLKCRKGTVGPTHHAHINRCLRYVLNRGVMNLELYIMVEEGYSLHKDWEWTRSVSSANLQRLTINHRYWNERNLESFILDAPSLTYLDYNDYFPESYPIVNLDSLVEAKLTLYSTVDIAHDDPAFTSDPTNLIKGLKNVEILNLSSTDTMEAFYFFRKAIPNFENLHHLSIATDELLGWRALPYMIKKTPNLKTLVIEGPLHTSFGLDYNYDFWGHDEAVEAVCECLCDYSFLNSCPLKILEITEWKATEAELEQMKHFLKNLSCLELVKVWVYETHHEEQKRLTTPLLRLSTLFKCKIQVLSRCCESMPVFNNLKSLAIKSSINRGWQAMPVLLRNCPRLETLVIEGLLHYETDQCGDACDCVSWEDKGLSLTSCPVKMLEVQGFRGTMKEMTMIKHFLVHFPCLKEMEIYVEEDDPTELRFPEVSKLIKQMMEDYNKLSSCNVQLLVSDYLYEKWTAEGRIL